MVAESMKSKDPYTCCLEETHSRDKDTHRLKVKRWKKVFHANGNKTYGNKWKQTNKKNKS